MTGPDHYREAEKLLGYAEARDAELRGDDEDMSYLAEAQVHATLALAAATAISDPNRAAPPRGSIPEWEAWQKTAGVSPTEAMS